jgi:hypothetical protein
MSSGSGMGSLQIDPVVNTGGRAPAIPALVGGEKRKSLSEFGGEDEPGVCSCEFVSRHWKAIVFSGASFACAATALALQVSNLHHWGSNPIGGAILSFTNGAGFQFGMLMLLPRSWMNLQKSFFADYAAAFFLGVSQPYLNLPKGAQQKAREGIFGLLNAHGGMCLAAFLHTIFTRRLSETEETTPFFEGEATRPGCLKIAFGNTSMQRGGWALLRGGAGLAAVVAGSFFDQVSILKGYGIYLAADAVGQIAMEGLIYLYSKSGPKEAGGGNMMFHRSAPSVSDCLMAWNLSDKIHRFFPVFSKAFRAAAYVAPGMLVVCGGAAEKAHVAAVPLLCYFLAGIFTGGNRDLEMARFTETPCNEMTEIKEAAATDKSCGRKTAEGIWTATKWTFATLGVGGFLVLTMAGFDPDNGKFEKIGPEIWAPVLGFTCCLYGSYAVGKISKYFFDKQKPNAWVRNSAYFWTHYSIGIPMLSLYIMEQLNIGNSALSQYKVSEGVFAGLAWASLGVGLGLETATRADAPKPRVISALYAALFLQFLVAQLFRQE